MDEMKQTLTEKWRPYLKQSGKVSEEKVEEFKKDIEKWKQGEKF